MKEVDRIRTITLMAMSGIKGGSSGKSKHMRNLVKETFDINMSLTLMNRYNVIMNFIQDLFIHPLN